MAWTVATFKSAYPEFGPTEAPVVQTALTDAVLECDPVLWGARLDRGVGLKAAHYLALAPFGQTARTKAATGITTYSIEFDRLARAVAGGPWLP